jgi:hypothetical protein
VEFIADKIAGAWDFVVDTERRNALTETRRGRSEVCLSPVLDFGKVPVDAGVLEESMA